MMMVSEAQDIIASSKSYRGAKLQLDLGWWAAAAPVRGCPVGPKTFPPFAPGMPSSHNFLSYVN